MNARWLAAVGAAMVLSAGPALAQKVPENASEVAKPGGKIPGAQKLALVKVADGFNDPVGVSVGQRRLRSHLRRRARRTRQGSRQGRQDPAEAVHGSDQDQSARIGGADRIRGAGAVVDRLPSEVQGERPRLRSLRIVAVQWRVDHRALHGRSAQAQTRLRPSGPTRPSR